MIDFTAYWHPVAALVCPLCGARAGAMCQRPSGHQAGGFHAIRRKMADEVFILQHGEDASIERTQDGWRIDPRGRIPGDEEPVQNDLFGRSA